jgi:Bacteriophage Mu, Gp36
MTLTRTDLLAAGGISAKELAAIADKLVEPGGPDPVETAIAEEQQEMERYIHRYEVDDEWQKKLLRALVLWELYKRIGGIPEKRQKAYDEAKRTLREIRDGKFPDVPLKETPPDDIAIAHGRSGSDPRYQNR